MDAKQFDALLARLTGGSSRRAAVKGVVGGALASAGVAATARAKKGKGKGKGKKKKVELCHCPDSNLDNCVTIRIPAKAARKHLKQHDNDTLGACSGPTTTTTAPPTTTTTT